MKKRLLLASIVATMLASSCSTPRDITYFQDLDNGAVVRAQRELEIRVKPEDKLTIMVSTQDPSLSALFNLVQVQNRLTNTTSSTKTVGTSTSSDGRVSFYTVDSQGDIMFPVLGKLHVAGMNREELVNYIAGELVSHDLVKDPIVNVEFANTGIDVIGQVKMPGRYEFNKDHVTIIDAIAMAGDLDINGMRENVMVMRQLPDGSSEVHRVNLTDAAQVLNSPAYYLQQNDVIYVEPNDKEKRNTTPNGNTPYTPSFWVSLGSFAITIATLVITLSK
ncbi:MAG: polysaccharide biosynthesis/export family protein [Muribaculaceae bacterium]|nr:polysaccharide biosynthesis/export family protein [Muribaculaceae bacterium]